MSEQLTVTNYIVRQRTRQGIADCSGAERDFAFNGGLLDAALARAAIIEPACCIEVVAARLMAIVHPCPQLSSHRSATGARRSD